MAQHQTTSPMRATLAWLGSTALATAFGIAFWQMDTLPFYPFALMIALPFTAVFITIVVWLMRMLALPRPATDVVGGAIGGALLCWLLSSTNIPWWLAIGCGAFGGLSYWLLAGEPRPPYVADRPY